MNSNRLDFKKKFLNSALVSRWGYQCDSPVGDIIGNLVSLPPNYAPSNSIPIKSKCFNNIDLTGLSINGNILKPLMFKCVYMWLRDGSEFWCWISYIYGSHLGGFRWDGSHWVNFEADLRKIDVYSN